MKDDPARDNTSKLVKWLYVFVLLFAAALIVILYEKILDLNIYVIYASLGLIIGMCIVLILHLVLREV
ncbi:MAG: hypothetical protein ACERKD_01020 [Prolixibacteraceae bacterium]